MGDVREHEKLLAAYAMESLLSIEGWPCMGRRTWRTGAER
jgi:hypothetical protein